MQRPIKALEFFVSSTTRLGRTLEKTIILHHRELLSRSVAKSESSKYFPLMLETALVVARERGHASVLTSPDLN